MASTARRTARRCGKSCLSIAKNGSSAAKKRKPRRSRTATPAARRCASITKASVTSISMACRCRRSKLVQHDADREADRRAEIPFEPASSGGSSACPVAGSRGAGRRSVSANQWGCRRSIQSRTRSRARRKNGTSSDSSMRPSGSIQSPKRGRTLRNPPATKRSPAGIRSHRDPGWRSQRVGVRSRNGRRSIKRSSRRSRRRVAASAEAMRPPRPSPTAPEPEFSRAVICMNSPRKRPGRQGHGQRCRPRSRRGGCACSGSACVLLTSAPWRVGGAGSVCRGVIGGRAPRRRPVRAHTGAGTRLIRHREGGRHHAGILVLARGARINRRI